MRLVDLILAILVLMLLVWVAGREFPSYEHRAQPRPLAEASPAPTPPPE